MKKPPSQRPERQQPKEPERDLIISPLSIGYTDEELIDLMHQYRTARERQEKGLENYAIMVFIRGYDDDPRELGDIPEVRDFCKRLVSLGFIADLEPSTMIVPPKWMEGTPGARPFGAMEIWFVAQNLLSKAGLIDIDMKHVEEFRQHVLPQANRTADMVLSRPWPPQKGENN